MIHVMEQQTISDQYCPLYSSRWSMLRPRLGSYMAQWGSFIWYQRQFYVQIILNVYVV